MLKDIFYFKIQSNTSQTYARKLPGKKAECLERKAGFQLSSSWRCLSAFRSENDRLNTESKNEIRGGSQLS